MAEIINLSKIKRWKQLNQEEKMNRLWFFFKLLIVVSILNGILEMIKSYLTLTIYGMI